MTEREACALLKARFEKAGYKVADNVAFDEDGLAFEIDGYDADARVGYEYVTEEAGDSWDVDVDAIEAHRKAGTLFVLVVDEADAPDAASLGAAADKFLAELPKRPAKRAAPKPPPIPKAAKAAKSASKPAPKKTAKKK